MPRVYPRRCGEAAAQSAPTTLVKVYPRRCGEALSLDEKVRFGQGLSPQVRGSQLEYVADVMRSWSIPAGAGKPQQIYPSNQQARVYPRRCGEAQLWDHMLRRRQGLSPQVRGSLVAG